LSESANSDVTQTIRFNGKRASVKLTRTEFDRITTGLLEMTFRLTDRVIADAKEKGVSRFDAFLMVGGSTFMLQVQEGLERRYAAEPALQGIKPIYHQPNKAVTRGAAKAAQVWAVQGAIEKILESEGRAGEAPTQKDLEKVATGLGMSVPEVRKTNNITLDGGVCPESYGVKYLMAGRDPNSENDEDYTVVNFVQKGSPRPANGDNMGTAVWDGQPSVSIEVWANDIKEEEAKVADSRLKGYLDFDFVSPMNRGDMCIKSEIVVDEQGMLHLYGTDTRGGERHHIQIDPNKPIVKKNDETDTATGGGNHCD
jgi:molecular chaperone DnaK (HSP70)